MSETARSETPLRPEAARSGWTWAQRWCVIIPIWYFALAASLDKVNLGADYFLTEWMATYTDGFVRRGLPGQTLMFLSDDVLHCAPMDLLKGFRLALAAFFLAILGYAAFRNTKTLGLYGTLGVLTTPMLSTFAWLGLGNVDLLFLLVCAAHAAMASKLNDRAYLGWTVLFFATVGSVAMLTHEGFLLLGFPINVILTGRKLGWRNWRAIAAIYTVPTLAGLACIKFSGTTVQSMAIQQQWLAHGVATTDNSAMGYFGKSVGVQARLIWAAYWNPACLFKWALAFFLSLLGLAGFFSWSPLGLREKRAVLRQFFLIPLAFSLPLCLIGSDWDRWVRIPFGSGLLALLFSDSLIREFRFELNAKQIRWALAAIILNVIVKPVGPYYAPMSILRGTAPATLEEAASIAVNHRV